MVMNLAKNSLRFLRKNYTFEGNKTKSRISCYLILNRQCALAAESKNVKLNTTKVETKITNKIIYNEVLQKIKTKKPVQQKNFPICLQYLKEDDSNSSLENESKINVEESTTTNFPLDIKEKFIVESDINKVASETFSENLLYSTPSDNESQLSWKSSKSSLVYYNISNPKNLDNKSWNAIDFVLDENFKYGTADPNVPVSTVPCGGCGAMLHCADKSLPGYLPKEVFQNCSRKQLHKQICQRCHFLKVYDIALGVNVSGDEYISIIKSLKRKRASFIVLVDLIDFPCSIWPEIFQIIGSKRPIIIVGNKIDLLIQEGKDFLKTMKNCLSQSLQDRGISQKNIVNISLISAKTGYGVEKLISTVQNMFRYRGGDIYLLGSTNAGKSTLFNTLLESDLCNVIAANACQRATISAWPGTTLNLLKFPVVGSSKFRLSIRNLRLAEENKEAAALNKLMNFNRDYLKEQETLKGHVGTTFESEVVQKIANKYKKGLDIGIPTDRDDIPFCDFSSPTFKKKKWLFDTPGAINRDQITHLLTTSELVLTLPKSLVLPRNFYLKPKMSLFIGGLARLDYVNGTNSAWFTVYASNEIPVTITKLENADSVYEQLLGTNLFRVPSGGKVRLEKWPKLESKELKIISSQKQTNGQKNAAADVVLSSAGWVTISSCCNCDLVAWTPEGRGIFLRKPPLILKSRLFKEKRIPNTPAFTSGINVTDGFSFLDDKNEHEIFKRFENKEVTSKLQ